MATKTHSRDTIGRTPDALWAQITPILGLKKTGTVGRPPTPNRVIFDAMIFVLRNGCQGQAIPREPTHPDRLSTAGSAGGCNKACSSELGRRCCITMIRKWILLGNGKRSMG